MSVLRGSGRTTSMLVAVAMDRGKRIAIAGKTKAHAENLARMARYIKKTIHMGTGDADIVPVWPGCCVDFGFDAMYVDHDAVDELLREVCKR